MARKGIAILVVSVLVLGVVSGCAGVPAGGAEAISGAMGFLPESFSLKLPPIYLQYVETADGSAEPSVLGIGASLLESWFGLNLGMVTAAFIVGGITLFFAFIAIYHLAETHGKDLDYNEPL